MAMAVGSPDDDGEEQMNSAINTTPLVDVMLVLLIIFLITIPVVTQSIQLTLPKERNLPTQTKPENILLAVSKDGDVLVMNEQVFAHRAAYNGKPESTLRSEQMTVWPDDEKMRTDKPVTLTQGQTVITADRMESDNIAGEIRLQGQVRGILYRTQAPKP